MGFSKAKPPEGEAATTDHCGPYHSLARGDDRKGGGTNDLREGSGVAASTAHNRNFENFENGGATTIFKVAPPVPPKNHFLIEKPRF